MSEANKLKRLLTKVTGDNNKHLICAFRLERVKSNLRFIRECRRRNVIPKGFCVQDKLKDTVKLHDSRKDRLMKKQAREWMKLAIDLLYEKKFELEKTAIFPLTLEDLKALNEYRYYLRCRKRKKMNDLIGNIRGETQQQNVINGFVNLSNFSFTPEEITLLNKGPSFVPPPQELRNKDKILFKANVQACLNRLQRKEPSIANSPEITRFLYGTLRITTTAKTERTNIQIHKNLKEIKRKNILIVPSDKTKRLVAMNTENYQAMVDIALNPSDKEVRTVSPLFRQQKFNRVIQRIANKYKDTECYQKLLNCKVSDPLPSIPYALPKDHKPGPIKGRPIISTISSIIRPLSILLANVLNPLVKLFVKAHIESTTQFIEIVKPIRLEENDVFGSLDVTNLYGSIPLEDKNNKRGLFSVVKEFYALHREESSIPDISPDDFETLMRLCLCEDRYLRNGKSYVQTSGIAMGNNAAPPFAIIFMDFIEKNIMQISNNITLWLRYVDDCFIVYKGDFSQLLALANSVHPDIQFTSELPNENKLPFLDTLVTRSNNKFHFELYVKPTHSGACLPFSAYVPTSRKRALVQSELLRANRISTDRMRQTRSVDKIKEKFKENGYPAKFVNETRVQYAQSAKPEKRDFVSYIKIPFVSEMQKWKIMKLSKSTGIENYIRLIFKTPRPLSWQFREKRENLSCRPDCIACKTSVTKYVCFTKFTVYEISCNICKAVYIGQTSRIIKSRIKEHTFVPSSYVYAHLKSHGTNNVLDFKWRILAVEANYYTRLALEAIYIKSFGRNIMNGCQGTDLVPFLL